uniref:KH type-2 domain-containing protein n=1 Tax=Nomascus leucogenys TaxID=61853 RepID=A0A2I3H0V8_NOMLE
DGIFKLAEYGYSGVEVRVTPTRTEIIILATRTQTILDEKGRRIRELTAIVQKRFGFPEGSVELYAEKVATRGLCAIAQAESLRYKLLGGLANRRVGSQSRLPCPSQSPQHNRVSLAAVFWSLDVAL